MDKQLSTSDFITKCNKIKSGWSARNKKFKDWYEIIKLTDNLAQEGMESVAANDPRTGYNLGRYLLNTAYVAHKTVQEDADPNMIAGLSYVESFITRRWAEHEKQYRQIGKQGWKYQLISWLLASGWYAVFSMVEKDKIWSEVWSPAETFPSYGDDGLAEVLHEYSLPAAAINKKIRDMGWTYKGSVAGSMTIRNHWGFDDNGDIANTILLGNEYVKPPTIEPELNKLLPRRLPVFISPVGGLPDTGVLDGKWQEHFGESIVAVNEQLAANYNKMLTYTQQLMRDTANPRWLELSQGDSPILKQEDLFKRGAIFRGQPGESVQPLSTAAIPVELRQLTMDYQNMIQRGLFNWITFGNIQQSMSYLAMANVASSSMQILGPYLDALKGLMIDMDEYWYQMMDVNNYRPYNFKKPSPMPDTVEFDTQVDIEIPGYLVQRATVARMLDPTFQLSTNTVMAKLFPEIRNTIKEQAEVRKDFAMSDPRAIKVDSIIASRAQALLLKDAKDEEGSKLYTLLADSLTQELGGQPQQQGQQQGQPIPRQATQTQPTGPLAGEVTNLGTEMTNQGGM